MVLLSLTSVHSAANDSMSFNANLTSDYLFRGVSQTDSGPALQVGLNYDFNHGVYAGLWASNVDFGAEDEANIEFDGYLGYTTNLANDYSLDVLYNYYTYQGYPSDIDINYSELIVSLSQNNLSYQFGYAPNYANSDMSALYVGIDYSSDIIKNYDVTVHGGYSFGDALEDSEYIDLNVSISRSIEQFLVSAMLSTTDVDTDNSDTRIVLSVSTEF